MKRPYSRPFQLAALCAVVAVSVAAAVVRPPNEAKAKPGGSERIVVAQNACPNGRC
jgi:hypothetical protein